MALQDIFKFRDLPESETSKPFLEHLEDLRWTIVKVAITLVAAMIICFAFRSTLVRVMQAPLHEIDPQVGALRALGITDSLVISFHLAFYAGIDLRSEEHTSELQSLTNLVCRLLLEKKNKLER